MGLFHVGGAERLVKPIILDTRLAFYGPLSSSVGVAEVGTNSGGTAAMAAGEGLSLEIISLLDVDPYQQPYRRQVRSNP